MTAARSQGARAEKRGRGRLARSRRGIIRRGFSLLELLIVLALVLAILSLAMPSLASWTSAGLRESREQLSSAAMVARGTARERGFTVELWGEGDGGRSLTLRRANTAGEPVDPAAVVATGPVLERLDDLPTGVEIRRSEAADGGESVAISGDSTGVLLGTFWASGGCDLDPWQLVAGKEVFRPVLNEWTGALGFEAIEQSASMEKPEPERVPAEGEGEGQ